MLNNIFFNDLFDGFSAWKKWYILGTQSIRSRYARSKLGQFWPSLSYFVTVLSLGLVYAYLWNEPIRKFLPYLSISHVFWTVISGSVLEGCSVFIDSQSLVKTEYYPRSMFVFSLLARQLTYFLHNFVVLIPLLILFPDRVTWWILLAIPGFFLVVINCYWMALAVGFLCARFRDLPNVISSIMQILYFVTPVMWEGERIRNPHLKMLLTELNPFASLLAIVRDPFIGIQPSTLQYFVVAIWTIMGYIFAVYLFKHSSRRLSYWL
ncbi:MULTISPECIES: ABC transporter permease [unclassified Polynucleobacter]|uniref:ABC transporter permease n=1 Tax=unclassified Polynucleobacter TaxID=2640945 RepID=UPI0024902216|nr:MULTISPECIES: ABC transporter permease [unclassified Polynucleobacter]